MFRVNIRNKLILKLKDILQKNLYSVRRTHIEACERRLLSHTFDNEYIWTIRNLHNVKNKKTTVVIEVKDTRSTRVQYENYS